MYGIHTFALAKRTKERDEVSRFLVYTFTGFAVLFGLETIIPSDGTPLVSFLVASSAGLAAIAASGYWILNYRQGGHVYVLVLTSYLVRMFFGIYVYTELDPGYFSGNGDYLLGHPEVEQSYRAARIVFDSLTNNTGLSFPFAFSLLNEGDSKNPLIHLWMGLFFVSGNSANAMDLAPFNAFHMAIAALGIVSLALNYGYPTRAAFLAGVTTAWYPFAFNSGLLWRDAIGFAFVVLSVALVSKFKMRNILSWPFFVGAVFLSFAHRTVYPVAIIMVNFLNIAKLRISQGAKSNNKTLIIGVGVIVVLVVIRLFSDYIFLYYSELYAADIIGRLIYLPILVMRAILGPFPWFDKLDQVMFWDRILDYAYHVLQLAVFLGIARHFRNFFSAPDMNIHAFVVFLGLAMLAPGIHTAYLAVSLPFAFARIFFVVRNLPGYLLVSLLLFLLFNVLFYLLGFSGIGISQSITGY